MERIFWNIESSFKSFGCKDYIGILSRNAYEGIENCYLGGRSEVSGQLYQPNDGLLELVPEA